MAADYKLVKQAQMSAQSEFDQSKTDLELETLLHGQKIVAVKEEVRVLKNQLASEQEKNTVDLWCQKISQKILTTFDTSFYICLKLNYCS